MNNQNDYINDIISDYKRGVTFALKTIYQNTEEEILNPIAQGGGKYIVKVSNVNVWGKKSFIEQEIDSNFIKLPLTENMYLHENFNSYIFGLLYSAFDTTRNLLKYDTPRLHTCISCKNDKVKLTNFPEGNDGGADIARYSMELVESGNADWSVFFCFVKDIASQKEAIEIQVITDKFAVSIIYFIDYNDINDGSFYIDCLSTQIGQWGDPIGRSARVEFKYLNSTGKNEHIRLLRPINKNNGEVKCLHGFCMSKFDFRTFRLDRISTL